MDKVLKLVMALREELTAYQLVGGGNGPPRLRRVTGLRGRSVTLELRHGPDTYGWQQSRIIHNGRKPDGATPRGGGRSSDCKPLSCGSKAAMLDSTTRGRDG